MQRFFLNLKLLWKNLDTFKRTEGGSLKAKVGEQYRTIELSLQNILGRERQFWATATKDVRGRTCFLNCFPGIGGSTERDYSMLCKMSNQTGLVFNHIDQFALNLRLEEE